MKTMHILVITAILGLVYSSPANSEETVRTPAEKKEIAYTGEKLKLKKRVDSLFDSSKRVNGKGQKKARSHIILSMDWAKIAKLCLGNATWKKSSSKNRGQFQGLLKDVITMTAFSRMGKFWGGTTYQITSIEIKGRGAVLTTVFTDKHDEEYTLTYYFTKKRGKWLMHDLAYESLVYSEQINEQISFFLKEKAFKELLGKLRKRKADLKESDATAKKS